MAPAGAGAVPVSLHCEVADLVAYFSANETIEIKLVKMPGG